jgi:hypothetical protein
MSDADPENITPAETFRRFLRADYPQEPGLPDEITSYGWFAHRGHRSSERSDYDDRIAWGFAWRAIEKLYTNVRNGSIRLIGTPGIKGASHLRDIEAESALIPPALIAGSKHPQRTLNVFKQMLELSTNDVMYIYHDILCVGGDVIKLVIMSVGDVDETRLMTIVQEEYALLQKQSPRPKRETLIGEIQQRHKLSGNQAESIIVVIWPESPGGRPRSQQKG